MKNDATYQERIGHLIDCNARFKACIEETIEALDDLMEEGFASDKIIHVIEACEKVLEQWE